VLLVVGVVVIVYAWQHDSAPEPTSSGAALRQPSHSSAPAPLHVRLLPPNLSDAVPCLQVMVSGGGEASYRWSRNGEILEAARSARLCITGVQRGELLTVAVMAGDGKVEEAQLAWPNNPPQVVGVSTNPEIFYRGVAIEALPVGRDTDQDELEYRYQWWINGDANPMDSDRVLAGDRFHKGDRVAVEIVANDGLEDGPLFRSSEAVVPDGPPLFVSVPPGTVTFPEYTYQLQAKDPDGDPVRFELLQGPEGMEVDAGSGLLHWFIPQDAAGEFPVEIRVQDADGASSTQSFSLSLARG